MSGYVPPQGTLLPILGNLAGADCEEPRLVLIDFGLAEGFLSTSSGCSGTAGYIPPETWETEHWYPKGHGWTSYKLESPNMLGVIGHMSVYKGISTLSTSSGLGISAQGDIFSMGIVFFQLMIGQVPNGEVLGILQTSGRSEQDGWFDLRPGWTGELVAPPATGVFVLFFGTWLKSGKRLKLSEPSSQQFQLHHISPFPHISHYFPIFPDISPYFPRRFEMFGPPGHPVLPRTRPQASPWSSPGSAFPRRCCSWLHSSPAWRTGRCSTGPVRQRPWRLERSTSWCSKGFCGEVLFKPHPK